jgi:alkyl hydroperoxide reductase subunit D
MTTMTSDTLTTLLREVGVETPDKDILGSIGEKYPKYLKDLRINISNGFNSPNLTKKESYLIAYGVAINEKNQVLIKGLEGKSKEEGASDEELAEIASCVSLLNANNVYYRFRHFTQKDFYTQTPAGIKMTIMVAPVTGKEFFELVSLVISALNGCEMCVNAHEESLLKLNSSQSRILDSVRLGAVIKSLAVIL